MADAVEQTVAWAGACGFDQKRTRALAEEVLLNHVDWNARVKALFDDATRPSCGSWTSAPATRSAS